MGTISWRICNTLTHKSQLQSDSSMENYCISCYILCIVHYELFIMLVYFGNFKQHSSREIHSIILTPHCLGLSESRVLSSSATMSGLCITCIIGALSLINLCAISNWEFHLVATSWTSFNGGLIPALSWASLRAARQGIE